MSSPSSTIRVRQSPNNRNRKRKPPVRYGFEDDEENNALFKTKRHKKKKAVRSLDLILCDLPIGILAHIVSFLSTSYDRFVLQTTNKLFHNLSNSPSMLRRFQFVSLSSPSSSSTSTTHASNFVTEDDDSETVIKRLLPFAAHNNTEAIFILGQIAIYVEDDLETGIALYQKLMHDVDDHGLGSGRGSSDHGGDVRARAKYELGNLFSRHRMETIKLLGHRYISEAASAGHAQSLLSIRPIFRPIHQDRNISNQTREEYRNEGKQLRKKAEATLSQYTCLQILLDKKNTGYDNETSVSASWKRPRFCGNPVCIKRCYRSSRTRVRDWLRNKELKDYWIQLKLSVLESCGCGSTTTTTTTIYDHVDCFWIPDFSRCQRCRAIDYCERACQDMHWPTHKNNCIRIIAAAAAPAAPAAEDDDDEDEGEGEGEGESEGEGEGGDEEDNVA